MVESAGAHEERTRLEQRSEAWRRGGQCLATAAHHTIAIPGRRGAPDGSRIGVIEVAGRVEADQPNAPLRRHGPVVARAAIMPLGSRHLRKFDRLSRALVGILTRAT